MHFVTGGAFNGKFAWVQRYYQLTNEASYVCYSGYKQELLHLKQLNNTDTIVINGAEQYVKFALENGMNVEAVIQQVHEFLKWERLEERRQLVIIGTDMSKGVVPIDRFARKWRDEVGSFYQWLMEKADIAHVIWYQIPQVIKLKEESC